MSTAMVALVEPPYARRYELPVDARLGPGPGATGTSRRVRARCGWSTSTATPSPLFDGVVFDVADLLDRSPAQ